MSLYLVAISCGLMEEGSIILDLTKSEEEVRFFFSFFVEYLF